MGTVSDCYDNTMMESIWGTMQLELLDMKAWQTRDELASAVFEWIECWYNSNRRHSSIGHHATAQSYYVAGLRCSALANSMTGANVLAGMKWQAALTDHHQDAVDNGPPAVSFYDRKPLA